MYELRVLTGLHQGAALPLCGDTWSVGAADTSDLALYDPGIAGHHCDLQLREGIWTLTQVDGPVHDHEGQKTEKEFQLTVGVPFGLSDIWLSVVTADTAWAAQGGDAQPEAATLSVEGGSSSHNEPVLAPKGGGVSRFFLLVPAAAIVFALVLLWRDSSLPMPVLSAGPPTLAELSKIDLADAAATRGILQRMLLERELSSRITMVEEPGKILLQGRFEQADLLQVITRMLQRFEQRYNSPVQVLTAPAPAPPLLPFSIRQVSYSRLPSILTADGRRIFVGDEFKGVRLIEINDTTLVFDGEQRIEVSW